MQSPQQAHYTNRIVSGGKAAQLCLLRSRDYSGHKAYYFIKLDPLKIAQFEKVADSGESFDLEAYGEIIASGYGEEVPQSVLEKMRREYGWNG